MLTISIGGFAVLTIINFGILAALVILDRASVDTVAASTAGVRSPNEGEARRSARRGSVKRSSIK